MIDTLDEIPITLLRPGSDGYYKDGKWVEDEDAEVKIYGSIQPYRQPGKLGITLPEGIGPEDALVIYSRSPIKAASQYGNTKADKVELLGNTYYAYALLNWAFHADDETAHYKAVFVMFDESREES